MRNPYVKFTSDLDLTRAVGGTIVGCWQTVKDGPWQVLVERPQAKPRVRAAGTRKPRAAAKAAPMPMDTAVSVANG